MQQKNYHFSPNGQGINQLKNWQLDSTAIDPTAAEANQLKQTPDGRLKYHDGTDLIEIATLADLSGLGGGSIDTEGYLLKVLLQSEQTFYVRNGAIPGNSGESEAEAFSSIEEALIVLSEKYEVVGNLILDLDSTHTLNCSNFPNFTGSGTITIKGNNSNVTFVAYEGGTEALFANWSPLSFIIEDVNFKRGVCSKFRIEGGKIDFKNVDFDQIQVEFDNCRTTTIENATNNNAGRLKFYRSNINLNFSQVAAEYYYCQVETVNVTYRGIFIVEACNIILRNPRLNNTWWTVTSKIVNSTIEFKSTWLTFENLGGDPQTKPLLSFQNCNLKDFPSNVDVTGNRQFWQTSILQYINCQTPLEFNNVNYNFSKHNFSGNSYAIELVNTAFLKEINITGSTIKRDPFSIVGNKNYDNSQTGIPAENTQEAIDYLFNLIQGNV